MLTALREIAKLAKHMVNINIEVPDELHKRLKLVAVMEETTIKDLVTEILREAG